MNQETKKVHVNTKYFNEEERKEAIKQNKTKYVLKKEWYCQICNNNKNYTLAGKSCHLKTKKHIKNSEKHIE